MQLPLVVEPDQLLQNLEDDQLLLVDLSKAENYAQAHIPGAVYVDYRYVINGQRPVPGALPELSQIQQLCRSIGLSETKHVVAYDDEGGGKASRFIWTLHVLGHQDCSLLNGGIISWTNEGHAVTRDVPSVTPSEYVATYHDEPVASKEEILGRLDAADIKLLDARSTEEYNGTNTRAPTAKFGHIPGAVNLNWLDTIDKDRNYRFLPDQTLQNMLNELGVKKEQEVVVYCMTHHRSAHSYVMLKHLGYPRVKGYPGAWFEWGNSPETPVET